MRKTTIFNNNAEETQFNNDFHNQQCLDTLGHDQLAPLVIRQQWQLVRPRPAPPARVQLVQASHARDPVRERGGHRPGTHSRVLRTRLTRVPEVRARNVARREDRQTCAEQLGLASQSHLACSQRDVPILFLAKRTLSRARQPGTQHWN
jgi:hypothetical protein